MSPTFLRDPAIVFLILIPYLHVITCRCAFMCGTNWNREISSQSLGSFRKHDWMKEDEEKKRKGKSEEEKGKERGKKRTMKSEGKKKKNMRRIKRTKKKRMKEKNKEKYWLIGWVLCHNNHCILFNAKSSSCIYIEYI